MPNELESIHPKLPKTVRARINPIIPIPDEIKPMPLEALETLSALTREKNPLDSTETSSASMKGTGSHIVDTTDQFVGKSLIITGATPPK